MLRYITCISIIFIINANVLVAQKSLQATRINTVIKIDGIIDSVFYTLSDSATGFIQMERCLPGI
jgi:hypothetical protein